MGKFIPPWKPLVFSNRNVFQLWLILTDQVGAIKEWQSNPQSALLFALMRSLII